MISSNDRNYLRRCIALAEQALEAGDEPFGSILVSAAGTILAEERNRVGGGDATRHPEFALARHGTQCLDADGRACATVYTSGEHCPMCAAAHAWVGLGRIVYASSTEQLLEWLDVLDAPRPPVQPLGIKTIAPNVSVDGPDPQLAEEAHALHRRYHHNCR